MFSESGQALIILVGSSIGLLMLIIAIAGTTWTRVAIYSSGIFLGCVRVGVYFCTAEFVFPLAEVFAYAMDTKWFYFVRAFLLLSIFGTLAGIVCSFDRTNSRMRLITGVSFLGSGMMILISCMMYWNYTAVITKFIGHDFYICFISGCAILACGIPYGYKIFREKFYQQSAIGSKTDFDE